MTETPNSEMNPTAAEMLKFKSGQVKRQNAAAERRTGCPASASRLSRSELNRP